MSVGASKVGLATMTKELARQWEHTKVYWADAKSQEFESKYLQELFTSVDAAVAVIDQLDKVIVKIRNDCE